MHNCESDVDGSVTIEISYIYNTHNTGNSEERGAGQLATKLLAELVHC